MAPQTRGRKSKLQLDESVLVDEADAEASQADMRPPSKRRNKRAVEDAPPGEETKKSTKLRREGKLARLQSMPVDILYEIFALLHPMDLVRLSRTTKLVRNIILSKYARSVWTESLASIPGLPACPKDMSEPSWARLLFEPTCHICFTSGVRNVMWCLRMRACARCLLSPKYFIKKPRLSQETEVEELRLAPERWRIPWEDGSGSQMKNVFFHRQDYEDMTNAMDLQKIGVTEHDTFVTEQTDKTQEIVEHAAVCRQWLDAERDSRESDIENIRQRRKEAILKYASDLGYEEEVRWLENDQPRSGGFDGLFHELKGVRQAKDLTHRMWLNMQAEIIEFMEEAREARKADGQLRVLKRRVELLTAAMKPLTSSYVPRVVDIYSMDSIREILDRPLEGGNDTVTAHSFNDALADFDAVLKHARASRRSELIKALSAWQDLCARRITASDQEDSGEGEGDSDFAYGTPTEAHLELATSLFTCQEPTRARYLWCAATQTCSADEFLTHHCWNRWPVTWGVREWAQTDRYQQLAYVCADVQVAGGAGHVHVAGDYARKAAEVVRRAGLDPLRATKRAMDVADAWFWCTCERCRMITLRMDGHRLALDWRQAVLHPASVGELERMAPPEEAKVRECARRLSVELPRAGDARTIWTCVRCPRSHMDVDTLRAHCASQHDISELVHKRDFTHEDSFLSMRRTFALKIKRKTVAGAEGATEDADAGATVAT